MKKLILLLLFVSTINLNGQSKILKAIDSPVLFYGDEKTAYRDPAVLFYNDQFFLFFTLVKTINGEIYSFTATSKSYDLINWSQVKILTPRDQNLNFCSPGNIVKYDGKWLLCLQTYPRPGYIQGDKVRYGSDDSRIFIMESKDLENWTNPKLLKVKGSTIREDKMGRMIDPYLIEDKDEKGKWWCFYKQNGVSMSYTYDFLNWTFYGNTKSGENVCVLKDESEYVMFHSPSNGIGIKRSSNLKDWSSFGGLITLGQKEWDWAKGRLTAGAVVDLRNIKRIAKYIMFFHGSGPNRESEGDFDKNSSIGIAWSDDLINWDWPKK
tara:strand:- start:195 stop:1163 length:969 start_codon:yes stop_codon:yes gene_type:complete